MLSLSACVWFWWFFWEMEVRMHLDKIMSRAGSFAQSSNTPRKNNKWLWEGGGVWDEEFRPGWADYPAAAPLQNGTLRRRDCIRINCFTPDRLPVAGALVCDWGDELLSWLLLTCFGDLPLRQLFNGIVCRAFHQKPSSFGASEHLNMTKYSAPHGEPAGWFYAKRDATQSKTKSRVNQTPPAAAGRETGDLSHCLNSDQSSSSPSHQVVCWDSVGDGAHGDVPLTG